MTQLLQDYIENGRSTLGEKLKNDISVDIWKLGTNSENKKKSLKDKAAQKKNKYD